MCSFKPNCNWRWTSARAWGSSSVVFQEAPMLNNLPALNNQKSKPQNLLLRWEVCKENVACTPKDLAVCQLPARCSEHTIDIIVGSNSRVSKMVEQLSPLRNLVAAGLEFHIGRHLQKASAKANKSGVMECFCTWHVVTVVFSITLCIDVLFRTQPVFVCHIRSSMVSKRIITALHEDIGVSQTCPVTQTRGFNSLSQQGFTSILFIHISPNAAYIADSVLQITFNLRSEIYGVWFQEQTSNRYKNWVTGDMSPYLDLIARKTHSTVYPSDKAYSHTSTFQIGSAGIQFWRLDVITLTS